MKDKFLKVYANLPLNLRKEIVLDLGKIEGPITWEVAYREIMAETEMGKKILEKLVQLDFIPKD
ncbi:MAG TPA: hypothetical protein VFT82_00785 [Candidatus Paceibacterota bacterium]|nr:hypothetical protein [Candidatus Paceibacterota bacterium]